MDSYSCTSSDMVTFSHTWEIKSLLFLKRCKGVVNLRSTEFAASEDSNDKFFMELVTAGNAPNEYLRVYLRKSSTNTCCKYKYDMIMSFTKNGLLTQLSRQWNFYEGTFVNEIYNEPNTFSIDDTLRIRCEIRILLADPVCISQKKFALPKCKILDDLFALLNSKEFADVTIVTGDGKKIPAHKTILAARCKVFAAMFKHPFKESQQNCVTISDFKYEAVLEMLRFIYTGCAPRLRDMTEELLSAADKYGLERLKAMCLNCLDENLCAETAVMTLKLADLYQEEGLKSRAIQYIKNSDLVQLICALKLNDK